MDKNLLFGVLHVCIQTKARVLATADIFEQSQDAFDKKKATHLESGLESQWLFFCTGSASEAV